MEIIDQNKQQPEDNWEQYHEEWQKRHRRGKIFGGIILVTAGALMLARQAGVEFPDWFFTWKVLLIVVGIYAGVKHSFRNFGWLIPIAIGSAFLVQDFYPELNTRHFFWPVMLMVVGLVVIFKPRNRHRDKWRRWKHEYRAKWEKDCGNAGFNSSDDLLDAVAVFGSVKKNIISKDFKGGEATACFGGVHLNLSQADINGKAVLELNSVFGGMKVIVPPHWEVQTSELVTVMGGIDDKRPHQGAQVNSGKILVLKGAAVFGGIEILNY